MEDIVLEYLLRVRTEIKEFVQRLLNNLCMEGRRRVPALQYSLQNFLFKAKFQLFLPPDYLFLNFMCKGKHLIHPNQFGHSFSELCSNLFAMLVFLQFLTLHESTQLLGSKLQNVHSFFIGDHIILNVSLQQVLSKVPDDFLIDTVWVNKGEQVQHFIYESLLYVSVKSVQKQG